MNRLPVFETVSRTYGFLIGDFTTIVRLAWVPLLLVAALNFYYGPRVMDAVLAAKDNPLAMVESMQLNFLISIAGLVTGIMVLVSLLRVVIQGDRKPGLLIYVWFGGAEFRLLLVYFLLFIALIFGAFVTALAFGIFAAIAANVPGGGVIIVAGMAALIGSIIWAVLKLLLVPAVVVAESSLGVERSWALMRGNALRMFFVVLLTYVPFAIAAIFIAFTLFGSELKLPDLTEMSAANKNPEAIKALAEEWQRNFFGVLRSHWLELSVFNYVTSLIGAGLFAGVSGNAYVALAGERH